MSDDKPKTNDAESKSAAPPAEEESPIETHHEIGFGKGTLRYTVTTGRMPIRDDDGEIEAHMFYMAYVLDEPRRSADRPLTFVFNGGPGSSSVWLHLGALGPRRVKMQDEGWMPAPPYRMVNNEHSWLDMTDLVFIDPIGTGFSRTVKKENNEKFWNLEGDFNSIGEFIRLYLTRAQRWSSPLFLAGESYGTTRAAGLAGHLIKKGIAFNGLALISTVMNFQTLLFAQGNDLPFELFLPTYTATAWYHGKLTPSLQEKPLQEVLAEVEKWVDEDYAVAMMKRDRLEDRDRQSVIRRLARYTGLDASFIDRSNLGIHIWRFCKELLREERRTVGRLDSRYKGIDALPVTEFPDFDPSMAAIMPPYTAMMNDYVRADLGYETDLVYETLSFKVNQEWQWDRGQFPDTSEALRSALSQNPYMQVFLAMGIYDLATPYYATRYTVDHMNVDPDLRGNFHSATYDAGHMLYLDVTSLAKLKQDIQTFMGESLGG